MDLEMWGDIWYIIISIKHVRHAYIIDISYIVARYEEKPI